MSQTAEYGPTVQVQQAGWSGRSGGTTTSAARPQPSSGGCITVQIPSDRRPALRAGDEQERGRGGAAGGARGRSSACAPKQAVRKLRRKPAPG